jgi:uncharacterized membrane protein YfcA
MLPELTAAQFAILASLGVGVGAVGATVGVGGGFLMVPALLVLYPDADPATITAMSLTAVVLNALSATVGYRRRRRQDMRTGGILVAAAVPAAMIGAYVTTIVERAQFDLIFGVALLLGAAYLALRGASLPQRVEPASKGRERRLVDSDGNVYAYRVNEPVAGGIAVFAGFIAAFFGIGGGPINVPVMMLALRIPSQIAVATSQLELMVASAAAVAVHLALSSGETDQWIRALILSGGTLVGAQIGVQLLAGRIGARTVLLAIAASLLVAGTRQVVTGLT